MDYFKTYDSGHLYGVGRIIVVVTVHQEKETSVTETFAFSIYDDTIFKGTVTTYNFDASEMIIDEIELHARNMIDQVLFEKFEAEKDTSILQNPKPVEIKESILISMKSRNYHIDKFEDIRDKTNCEAFREYLNKILSLPEITVREYSGPTS